MSLIVHGIDEMEVDGDSGAYSIYLFSNWHIMEESCIHISLYTSTTNIWTIQVIGIFGDNIPLFSRRFHSPLWSLRRDNIITCVSTDCQYFLYSCYNNNHSLPNVVVTRNFFMESPAMINFKYHFGEICYIKYVFHMSFQWQYILL